jgi:casein kinase 1
MQYSRKLGFDETPDYNWLRGLFLDVLNNLDEQDDGIFDWQLLNDGKGWQSLAKERRQARNASRKLLGAPPLNSQTPQNEYVKAHQTLQEPSKHHSNNNNVNDNNHSSSDNRNLSSITRTAWSKFKSFITCGIF